MILIDSNVPMYLVGAAHRHKDDALRILDQLISRGEPLATDAEVLQEILHRYSALDRPDAIQPAFHATLSLVDHVYPIGLAEVEAAKDVLLGAYGLSARDAIHVAVMKTHDVSRIFTFDSAFDRYPGIERIAA